MTRDPGPEPKSMSLRRALTASLRTFRGPWILLAVCLLLAAGHGCGRTDRPSPTAEAAGAAAPFAELVRLYEARDYFALRERLAAVRRDESPGLRVLRAAVTHAFNDPARSNAMLDSALAEGRSLSDSLRYDARRIRLRNLLRLGRYPEARRASEALLASPPAFVDSSQVQDFRNMRRFTGALVDIAPQRVVHRTDTGLRLRERGQIRVSIGDSVREYAIDTGANFSALIRSEAEALGLDVRPADVEVGTSTDIRVRADVAVADRVRLGEIELRDVVFLVFPDEVFTFPDFVIRGIIGFPVVEALGELRLRQDGTIEIPRNVPAREIRNLALHQLMPLVQVGYGEDDLVCRFDTGADRTVFYEPFYRQYEAWVEAMGTPDTSRTGGAGGIRKLPGYRLDRVTLRVGGKTVALADIHVHTRVLVQRESENDLDCNLGWDVLSRFDGYVLNFRSMSLLLR